MTAGIYLHIPFCKSRCSYCDFATDVYRDGDAVRRYVYALCKEIRSELPAVAGGLTRSQANGESAEPITDLQPPATAGGSDIDTIYFGGGTPSLLHPQQVEQILTAVHEKFDVTPDAEITMEMNPGGVTPESLAEYKELGVNRASFGVQTFNDRDLKLLARGHDANDARETFKMLREAGFENISFDLIAGLPGQTIDDWSKNLDEATAMSPEHISLYLLEIHEGTPLAEQVNSGRRPMPDDALAAEMYEVMLDRLTDAGYEQYEISNFAKPGFESRHNTKYWRLDPVFGFGVSAHSFDGTQRYANERDTAKYVEMIEKKSSARIMTEDIDVSSEFAFLGLRLTNGVDLTDFSSRFGFDLAERYVSQLERLRESELIETRDGRLKLTRKGMLFSNEVFSVFV